MNTSMRLRLRLRQCGAVMAMAFVLAACGGGGGGSDDDVDTAAPAVQAPPAAAGSLQASTGDASGAAASADETAARLVALRAGLSNSPLGAGAGAQSFASTARLAARRLPRENALVTETVSCAEFFEVSPCTGTVTADTNLTDRNADVLPAGTYLTLTFNGIRYGSGATATQLSGSARVDLLTALDSNAASLNNVRLQLTLTNLAGSSAGVDFGPQSLLALLEYDAQGRLFITADGLRYDSVSAITATDARNYNLPDVTIRRALWNAGAGHVDLRYRAWNVVAGRPTVGSQVTATAGANSIALTVTASTSTTVVYDADVSVGGVVTPYTVTATYPAAGGAPTYVAVPG